MRTLGRIFLFALTALALTPSILRADHLGESTTKTTTPGQIRIKAKLDSIIIDRFNFEQPDLDLILPYLSKRSKELDPEHAGVSFVLEGAYQKPSKQRSEGMGIADVPLSEVLRFVCTISNHDYQIEDDRVVIYPSKK